MGNFTWVRQTGTHTRQLTWKYLDLMPPPLHSCQAILPIITAPVFLLQAINIALGLETSISSPVFPLPKPAVCLHNHALCLLLFLALTIRASAIMRNIELRHSMSQMWPNTSAFSVLLQYNYKKPSPLQASSHAYWRIEMRIKISTTAGVIRIGGWGLILFIIAKLHWTNGMEQHKETIRCRYQ